MSLSGSYEPVPFRVTIAPCGLVCSTFWSGPALATGGWFWSAVIVTVSLSVLLSVESYLTVRVALYTPEVV